MSLFPDQRYPDAGSYASAYIERLSQALRLVDRQAISAAGALLAERAAAGRMIFSCGNGGSAAIANHLVCDCLKGVRTGSSLKPKVHSLSATIELITAITNDIGAADMFSYQLASLAGAGDVLIAISSSGSSPNIVKALSWARENGVATIAMTGFSGGEAATMADISLHVQADNYGMAEDIHQSLMHILAQYLRHSHLLDPKTLGVTRY